MSNGHATETRDTDGNASSKVPQEKGAGTTSTRLPTKACTRMAKNPCSRLGPRSKDLLARSCLGGSGLFGAILIVLDLFVNRHGLFHVSRHATGLLTACTAFAAFSSRS